MKTVKLTQEQQTALRLAILECQDNQKKYPDIVELAELVEQLKDVLALLYRAKSITLDVDDV